LRSGPIDHVVVVRLSTVETLDPIHLRLVSLTIVDAVMRLCKQDIVFILDKSKRR
jgi:hypothetical protein